MTVHAQRSKRDMFRTPATAATTTTYVTVDTLGFDYAVIDAVSGPTQATNTSAKWTSIQLNHGTTTDVSNSTAVTGPFVGTTNATATTSQFVLPEHNDTSNESCTRFFVDLRHLERYVGLQAQPDNVSDSWWYTAELWRGDGMGDTAAKRGVAAYTEG